MAIPYLGSEEQSFSVDGISHGTSHITRWIFGFASRHCTVDISLMLAEVTEPNHLTNRWQRISADQGPGQRFVKFRTTLCSITIPESSKSQSCQ
jgi:hypothetical protein